MGSAHASVSFRSSPPELSYPHLSPPITPASSPPKSSHMDDTASDATHDSLADSTYEIISAANTRSSDDEESHQDDTESLMSFGEPNTNEQGTYPQRDYVSPEASRVITPAPDTSDEEEEDGIQDLHIPAQSTSDIDRSEMTDGTILKTPRASTNIDPSVFDEISSLTEISRTIDSSAVYVHSGRVLEHPRVSIHQTVAPSKLEIGRTFRILWHGSSTHQDEVIQKIGQALAVSGERGLESSILKNSSSRFSIVPLSSFEGETYPEITMIPADKEIIVDKCEICQANLKGTYHQAERRRHDHSILQPPDLEIFFYTDAHGFFEEYDDIRPYTEYSFLDIRPTSNLLNVKSLQPCHGKAIHMRLEANKSTNISDSTASIAVPIDMDHFQDLDPALLNRNLRCLLDENPESKMPWQPFPLLKDRLSNFGETVERFTGLPLWKAALTALAAMLVYGALFKMTMASMSSNKPLPPEAVPVTQTVDTTTTVTITSTVQPTSAARAINTSLLDASSPTPSPTGVRDVGIPLHDAHPQPPFKFELLRSDQGKLYLKLPLEMARLRRPPPIQVTAQTWWEETPLEVALSKWNASMYSLEVKNLDPSQTVTITVDSEKASGLRQVFHVYPAHQWNSMRYLGPGYSVCLRASQDLVRAARKELNLFRDQANGKIISSSDWLYGQMKNARQMGGSAAGDLWERLSSRRDLITSFMNTNHSPELLGNVRERVASANTALIQRVTSLIATSKDLEKSVVRSTDAKAKRIRQRWTKSLPGIRSVPLLDATSLQEAQRRANILARKAGALIAASKPSFPSTENAKEEAYEDVHEAHRPCALKKPHRYHSKGAAGCKRKDRSGRRLI